VRDAWGWANIFANNEKAQIFAKSAVLRPGAIDETNSTKGQR